MRKSIITILGVMLMALFIGTAFADPWETYRNTAYSRSDVVIGPTYDFTTSAAGTATLTNGATIPSGKVLAGDVTGTASRIAAGSFLDIAYGLKNSTANKMQINLSANKGLAFDTGGSEGALRCVVGDGNDLGASGISVDVTDLVAAAYGTKEVGTNDIGVNLSANMGLRFGTAATEGSIELFPGDGINVGASGTEVDVTDIVDQAYGIDETTTNNIGVNLTPNAGLEFSAVSATFGSLGINLDGYSLALGASGLKLNASDSQEVDTIAVNDADGLTVNNQIVPVYTTLVVPINNQSVDEYVFVADDAWVLVKAEEIHSVAGTEVAPIAANLTIRVCDDNEAVTAGINSTISVIPLNDAANNINTASLNSTNINLANGDMIAFDYAGTLTGLRGSVTLTLRRV